MMSAFAGILALAERLGAKGRPMSNLGLLGALFIGFAQAVALVPKHVSVYALTNEEGTHLNRLIGRGKTALLSEVGSSKPPARSFSNTGLPSQTNGMISTPYAARMASR